MFVRVLNMPLDPKPMPMMSIWCLYCQLMYSTYQAGVFTINFGDILPDSIRWKDFSHKDNNLFIFILEKYVVLEDTIKNGKIHTLHAYPDLVPRMTKVDDGADVFIVHKPGVNSENDTVSLESVKFRGHFLMADSKRNRITLGPIKNGNDQSELVFMTVEKNYFLEKIRRCVLILCFHYIGSLFGPFCNDPSHFAVQWKQKCCWIVRARFLFLFGAIP